MTKAILAMTAAALLCAGTALAVFPRTTPQQSCDYARLTAWKTYLSCVDRVLAMDAKGTFYDESGAFAKCRHQYFSNWAAFQRKAFLAGSTCVGSRFTDNGDGTVTDAFTALVWEQKTDDGSVHDEANSYQWSAGSENVGGSGGNGSVFTSFLATLNSGAGFAGANGWRLPTFPELQTILLDYPCTSGNCSCPSDTCVDTTFGPTQTDWGYWSATSRVTSSSYYSWLVLFDGTGFVGPDFKTLSRNVRAVRGGL